MTGQRSCGARKPDKVKVPGLPKQFISKPVGQMSIFWECDKIPGVFSLGAFSDAHSGLQAPGPEVLGQNLGIPRTEKWLKTGHSDHKVAQNRLWGLTTKLQKDNKKVARK